VGLFSDAIEARLPALPVAALASAGDRWWLRSVRGRRVRERRGALAPDDRGCLVYEIVVRERLDHEQREVDAGVMSLRRLGSPTWRLHTGKPSLMPSSSLLPRTTVQRVSPAKTRRVASTWSSRSAKRASRAKRRPTSTSALSFHV